MRNIILSIRKEDSWITDKDKINEYFVENFTQLYQSSFLSVQSLEELVEPVVSNLENDEVIRIPSEEEIKAAIWEFHPLKSLGSDGFLGIFFRKYWSIIKERLVKFIQEVFRLGTVPFHINKSFLVLIPMIEGAATFGNFRLISLCNFIIKIISKILTLRLEHIISKIVSPHQRAFVKGRWIAENSVIAQEALHKVRKHKGSNGLMMMKIDLKKGMGVFK